MSDYISREAMSETPKCPGCGADMELMRLLCNATFYYVCPKCDWDSPVGIDSESAFRMAMRRAEPKNRVLTLEELREFDKGEDFVFVWLEYKEKKGRYFSLLQVYILHTDIYVDLVRPGDVSICEHLNINECGKTWRCWLRKPTETERWETPWEGDSHE